MNGTSVIYFKALNRPFHMLQVERTLFLLIVALCIPVAFTAQFSLLMDVMALIMFLLLYTAGRLITKSDNQMLLVYRNHIQYQRYYAPGSGLHAKTPIIKASVPMYVGKRGLS